VALRARKISSKADCMPPPRPVGDQFVAGCASAGKDVLDPQRLRSRWKSARAWIGAAHQPGDGTNRNGVARSLPSMPESMSSDTANIRRVIGRTCYGCHRRLSRRLRPDRSSSRWRQRSSRLMVGDEIGAARHPGRRMIGAASMGGAHRAAINIIDKAAMGARPSPRFDATLARARNINHAFKILLLLRGNMRCPKNLRGG